MAKDKKDKKQELTEQGLTIKYWLDRAEKLILTNENIVIDYEERLKTAYELAKQRIQSEVEAFYNRYAVNNEISLADARARLSREASKDFRKAQKTYIKAVKEASKKAGFSEKSQAYIDKAKRLGSKAYISKVDEITARIDYELEQLAISQAKGMQSIFKKGYDKAYQSTAKTLDGGMKMEVKFTDLGNKQLLQAVQSKWMDENFSDRIWINKAKLIKNLEHLLPQEFVRGKGPKEVARDLAQRMDVSYSNAERLVRTEMNYISNQAILAGFEEANITEFQFEAILDERTSEICREMNGQTFKIDEAEAGVNVPPLHPNCRSTIVPYFAKTDTAGEDDITDMIF